jgi:hypothetical protein
MMVVAMALRAEHEAPSLLENLGRVKMTAKIAAH